MYLHGYVRMFSFIVTLSFQDVMIALGMEAYEISALFKTLASILHFGNIEVKHRPQEEWAHIPNTSGQHPGQHSLFCLNN